MQTPTPIFFGLFVVLVRPSEDDALLESEALRFSGKSNVVVSHPNHLVRTSVAANESSIS